MGMFCVLSTYVILAAPGGEGSLQQAWGTAPIAGSRALEHIGWGFGVYIPVLLGFYAIVIGGQFVASSAVVARTRRTLGLVAQAMAAALVPALLLILAACVHQPSQAGALVVIVPVTGVTFFLAIQLGGFVVFENSLKLEIAFSTREWAQERMQILRVRGRRPMWLVVIVNALVGGGAAFVTTLCFVSPQRSWWLLFLVYFLFALGLTLINAFGVHTLRTARDRSSKIAAWLLPVSMGLTITGVALNLFIYGIGAVGGAIFAILALCSFSALWPRRHARRFWLDWSVQGAGTAHAARTIARKYVRATREIRELAPATSTEVIPTLRERVSAAVQAFRAKRLSSA